MNRDQTFCCTVCDAVMAIGSQFCAQCGQKLDDLPRAVRAEPGTRRAGTDDSYDKAADSICNRNGSSTTANGAKSDPSSSVTTGAENSRRYPPTRSAAAAWYSRQASPPGNDSAHASSAAAAEERVGLDEARADDLDNWLKTDSDAVPKPTAEQAPPLSQQSPAMPATPAAADAVVDAAETIRKREDDPGAADPAAQELQQTRARLQQAIDRSRQALFGLQEPIPQKPPRAIARLTAALHSTPADEVQKISNCLKQLGSTGSPAAIQPLRDYVDSRQRPVRLACLQALAQIPHASSSLILLGVLSGRTPEVLEQAIRGLVRLGHPESLPAVLALALIDTRYHMVLVDAIGDLDEALRDELACPLKQAVESDDPEISALAVSLLSRLRINESPRLFMKLTRHDAWQIRAAAVEALNETDEKQAVRYVNAAMTDPVAEVRVAAARGLRSLQSPRSMKLLAAALQDPDLRVRRATAGTLNEIGGEDATKAIAAAIKTETDPETTLRLLEGLSKAASVEALASLIRLLDSEDPHLCHGAITALRRLKNPRAVPHLVKLLDNNSSETRRLAVETLGRLSARKVAHSLRDIVKLDDDEDVRAAAARALGELNDGEAVTALEEALHDSRNVKCQAVISLGRIGRKSSVPALLVQLKDAAPEVRYHACNALGQIGQLSNPEPLKALLEDPDAMVRRGAETALNKLGIKITSAHWLRPVRKAVRAVSGLLVPDVAAGGIPLAGLGIAAAAVLLVVGIGYGLYSGLNTLGFSGSSYNGPISYVVSASVNADGSRVAVLRNFGVVELWDAEQGNLSNRFKAETRTSRILFAGDNQVLLYSRDGVKVWDTAADSAGTALTPLSGDQVTTVQRIVSLPDGKTAYLFSGKNVAVFDLVKQRTLRTFQLPVTVPSAVAVSPDQELLLYGDQAGEIHILSAQDGSQKQAFQATRFLKLDIKETAQVENLAFSHDGRFLAISFNSRHVQIWDMQDAGNGPQKTLREELPVARMAFHPSELKLLLLNQTGVHLLSENFDQRKSIPAGEMGSPTAVQLSADGKTLVAFVDEGRDIWVFNLKSLKLKQRLSVGPS